MSILDSLKHKVTKIEKKSSLNKPEPYDFTEYKNIEDMKGYIGFITPQGTFYRVRKIGMANGGHGEWAYAYLYNLGRKPSVLNFNANTLELLNNPEFNFTMIIESRMEATPIFFCPGVFLTDEQRQVINALTNSKDLSEDLIFVR